MKKMYKLVFVYPDGHIEEIDQIFTTGSAALEYGDNLLGQVAHTESLRSNRPYLDEAGFVSKDPIEPYYMVVELYRKKKQLVFDSRAR